MMDWIQEQLAAGKKEKDIVEALKANGWKEEDARKAIASHAAPTEHLERADINIITASLLGVLLFTWFYPFTFEYTSNIYTTISDQVFTDLVPAAFLVAAILLVGWTLFELAIKHRHPHLHRAYFLWAAVTVGVAVFLWFTMATSLLLQVLDVTLGTAGFLILASLFFAAAIVSMESVYNRLCNRYENVPVRSAKRLAVVGIAIAVFAFIILTIAAFFTFNSFVDNQNMWREKMATDAEFQLVDEERILNVPNSYLRERLVSSPQPGQLPSVSLGEILRSEVAENRCDALYASFFWQTEKVVNYRTALQYRSYMENGTNTTINMDAYRKEWNSQRETGDMERIDARIVGVSYAEMTTLYSCFWKTTWSTKDLRTAPFPAEPNLNDPDQSEVVKFFLWQEEQKRQDDLRREAEDQRWG
jgi:hypothetical protein